MTPHDRQTLERYSRGEWTLAKTCSHLGLTEAEVRRWMREAGIPEPKPSQG